MHEKIPADSNVSPNADENRTHRTATRCKWRRKFVSVIARWVSRRHFSMHCQNESLSTGSITYFLNRASRLTALPRSEISTNRRARNRKKRKKEISPLLFDNTTNYYEYRIENPFLLLNRGLLSRSILTIVRRVENLDFLSGNY